MVEKGKAVLVVHHRPQLRRHLKEGVTAAVADALADIKGRLFPAPTRAGDDWLLPFFEAFSSPDGAAAGWERLLERSDLVLAVIAEGGVTSLEALEAAVGAAARVLVFSDSGPGNGAGAGLDGWSVDRFDGAGSPPVPDEEAVRSLLEALALLNRPLAAGALDELGRDFDLEEAHERLRPWLVPFGGRFVVSASLSRKLLDGLAGDRLRAGHRACLGLLSRQAARDLQATRGELLVWRYRHGAAAGEMALARTLADRAIQSLDAGGRHADLLAFHRTLGGERRYLEAESALAVARAQIQMGLPERAYSGLRSLPEPRDPKLVLRRAILEAEALRSQKDEAGRRKSIEVLEGALGRVGASPDGGEAEELELWRLTAEHDRARNLHYFRPERTAEAVESFEKVVAASGERVAFAHLKAAALRNLSDARFRYTFGRLPPDLEKARRCLEEALAIVRDVRFPGARSLLPEILYQLAKMERASGKRGAAAALLAEAIEVAREQGVGFILSLARNKEFWWRFDAIDGPSARDLFSPSEWELLERRLEMASGHSWVGRAWIDTRVRAARCFELRQRPDRALELLAGCWSRLEKDAVGYSTPGDFEGRWVPVAAGLAVLTAQGPGEGSAESFAWRELRERAAGLGLEGVGLPEEPRPVWEGVE
jgi:tetratricopeptide (TPR) repeat protein